MSNEASPEPTEAARPARFFEGWNGAEADLMLRCPPRPGLGSCLFAVRRSVLIAASAVFEDMLNLPQAGPREPIGERFSDQQAPGVLPVVDLSESPDVINVILSLTHRELIRQVASDLQSSQANFDVNDFGPCLAAADKYDIPSVTALLSHALESYADMVDETHPCDDYQEYTTALALAITFNLPTVARKALRTWWDAIKVSPKPGQAFPHFCKIHEDIFVKVPASAIQQILLLEVELQSPPRMSKKDWLRQAEYSLEEYLD